MLGNLHLYSVTHGVIVHHRKAFRACRTPFVSSSSTNFQFLAYTKSCVCLTSREKWRKSVEMTTDYSCYNMSECLVLWTSYITRLKSTTLPIANDLQWYKRNKTPAAEG